MNRKQKIIRFGLLTFFSIVSLVLVAVCKRIGSVSETIYVVLEVSLISSFILSSDELWLLIKNEKTEDTNSQLNKKSKTIIPIVLAVVFLIFLICFL